MFKIKSIYENRIVFFEDSSKIKLSISCDSNSIISFENRCIKELANNEMLFILIASIAYFSYKKNETTFDIFKISFMDVITEKLFKFILKKLGYVKKKGKYEYSENIIVKTIEDNNDYSSLFISFVTILDNQKIEVSCRENTITILSHNIEFIEREMIEIILISCFQLLRKTWKKGISVNKLPKIYLKGDKYSDIYIKYIISIGYKKLKTHPALSDLLCFENI